MIIKEIYKGHEISIDRFDFDEDGQYQNWELRIDGMIIRELSNFGSLISAAKSYIDRGGSGIKK